MNNDYLKFLTIFVFNAFPFELVTCDFQSLNFILKMSFIFDLFMKTYSAALIFLLCYVESMSACSFVLIVYEL